MKRSACRVMLVGCLIGADQLRLGDEQSERY